MVDWAWGTVARIQSASADSIVNVQMISPIFALSTRRLHVQIKVLSLIDWLVIFPLFCGATWRLMNMQNIRILLSVRCLFALFVSAPIFQPTDLWSWFLCTYIGRDHSSGSKVTVLSRGKWSSWVCCKGQIWGVFILLNWSMRPGVWAVNLQQIIIRGKSATNPQKLDSMCWFFPLA